MLSLLLLLLLLGGRIDTSLHLAYLSYLLSHARVLLKTVVLSSADQATSECIDHSAATGLQYAI